MSLLAIAVVVLWILVIGLAITVYALTRQIGVLYERVAPAGALMMNQALSVDDAAPGLAVQTLQGSSINIGPASSGANLARPQLLFFLAPDCPICKTLLPVVKSIAKQESGVEVILASDGDDVSEHQGYVEMQGLESFPYVLSELLGKSFGVSKLPYAVLIRANGTIGSLGIVNSREHLESLFEAEALGIASLQDYLAGPPSDQFVDATAKRP